MYATCSWILSVQFGHYHFIQDLLDQVKDSHSVAHGREEMGAIRAEEQIALAVDSAQQVRKLVRSARELNIERTEQHTLKSVFIVTYSPSWSIVG